MAKLHFQQLYFPQAKLCPPSTILGNIINVFTFTFDRFNACLLKTDRQTDSSSAYVYLPEVANNRSISPTVFCIKAHCSILEDNEVYGLVKPPKEKLPLKCTYVI